MISSMTMLEIITEMGPIVGITRDSKRLVTTCPEGVCILWEDRSYNDYDVIDYRIRLDYMNEEDQAERWLKDYNVQSQF